MVAKETAVTCVIGIVATVTVFGAGYLYGCRTVTPPTSESTEQSDVGNDDKTPPQGEE